MRNLLLSFIFCLFLALPLAAQQSKDIQAELESKYKGQVVKTKVSFQGVSIHFDSAGNPKHRPGYCVSWTLCNLLEVEKVSVNDHAVKVEGQRIGVGFENGKEKFFRLRGEFAEVEIDVDGTPDLQKSVSALCRAFVCKNEAFANYLPYAWARYFDPKTTVPSPAAPVNAKDARKVESMTKILRVSAGVQASKVISQARPHYPDIAKSYRQEGTVVMNATIGTDGKIHDLFITSPAGFGLDEEALGAVRQWTYRPTMLMGEPVEVQTTISVNFSLRR
jgi:TonB family protein